MYTGDGFIVKVGQTPSLADLQFADITKEFAKYLKRDGLQEYKKAIGLAANGVGAGSFVYLRRIFEKLIQEAYEKNKTLLSLAEEDFKKLRMVEKVTTLSSFLPSQLVDMKDIYGILSKGVHELTEQECLTYFPALKLSIKLIIEQKIEQDAKSKKDEEARKQIIEIQRELKAVP